MQNPVRQYSSLDAVNALIAEHCVSNVYDGEMVAVKIGEWRQDCDCWSLPFEESNLPEHAKAYPKRLKLAPYTNELRLCYEADGTATVGIWLAT